MEFNTNTVIIYFTLVILVILVIYILVRLKKNRENFDVTNNNNNAAINNLGNIAASIMNTTTGTLTMPADTTVFTGDATIKGSLIATAFNLLPTGLIVAWNNAVTIPSGWILCDGTNSTPDLRGRFILGAGQGGNDMNNNPLPLQTLGSFGGEVSHTLVITEMPSHMHTSYGITGGSNRWTYPGDGNSSGSSNAGNTSNTGGDPANNNATVPHNNMPPYYVLVYIIKL